MPPFQSDLPDPCSRLQHPFGFLCGTCQILVLSFGWFVGVSVAHLLPEYKHRDVRGLAQGHTARGSNGSPGLCNSKGPLLEPQLDLSCRWGTNYFLRITPPCYCLYSKLRFLQTPPEPKLAASSLPGVLPGCRDGNGSFPSFVTLSPSSSPAQGVRTFTPVHRPFCLQLGGDSHPRPARCWGHSGDRLLPGDGRCLTFRVTCGLSFLPKGGPQKKSPLSL